ncbi:thermostable hemolysin [Caballeronia sp. LZ035]|uniref:thermostable hemolysin n=1 Tax=Caballeronia sp. LZ035 TaxID=3038568 RepID=UPI002859A89D|nr:thermostable hemolysin [Caballeronia sp. LZ035]MDR5755967.1 thermostable hemolysin [Caballeronia sp. LZ035]
MYIVRNVHPGQPAYREVQQAVSQHYYRFYGARPEPTPDQFLCLTELKESPPVHASTVHACVGLSWGDSSKLFSEYYIDTNLTQQYGLSRRELVEFGQFSSFGAKGAGRYLMVNAFRMLSQHHYRYVLMTATERVRGIMQALQIDYDDLGCARPSRVRDEHTEWGSYYNNSPRVVMAHLDGIAAQEALPPWQPQKGKGAHRCKRDAIRLALPAA